MHIGSVAFNNMKGLYPPYINKLGQTTRNNQDTQGLFVSLYPAFQLELALQGRPMLYPSPFETYSLLRSMSDDVFQSLYCLTETSCHTTFDWAT